MSKWSLIHASALPPKMRLILVAIMKSFSQSVLSGVGPQGSPYYPPATSNATSTLLRVACE